MTIEQFVGTLSADNRAKYWQVYAQAYRHEMYGLMMDKHDVGTVDTGNLWDTVNTIKDKMSAKDHRAVRFYVQSLAIGSGMQAAEDDYRYFKMNREAA